MDPLALVTKCLGQYKRLRNEALYYCPFCSHHKQKLSVNTESFFWKCWVCDAKGRSLFSLLRKHGNQECLTLYKKEFPEHFQPELAQIPKDFKLELPDEYVPLCSGSKTFDGRRALRYLKSRNVNSEAILRHKIGLASSGRYRDRVILPSFDADGRLNFYTGRTVTAEKEFRYLNPPTPSGYRNTIILNDLNIDWSKPIFLVEGFMDMIQAGSNAVPLFGSTLSESSRLFLEIVTHEPEVYVCLDSDARSKQINILSSLTSHGIICYDLDVSPYKDVGEMTRKILAEKQLAAQQADRVSLLRHRIRNL